MYTEEEAKTKWCPMVRVREDTPDEEMREAIRCEASQCMMWRWFENGTRYSIGHCGLAGKP
jgi:hypothetical protein